MPEPALTKAIVTYLETYGQPQFVWSIRDVLFEQAGVSIEAPDLTEHLNALVSGGYLKEVDGGVNSAGTKQVMYAPKDFEG